MPTWDQVALDFAGDARHLAELPDILRAFASAWPRGGPPAPPELEWDGDFSALEVAMLALGGGAALVAGLSAEVDPAQAAMFGRRFDSVDSALAALVAELGDPEARVLRVGLRHRLASVLAAPGPHAPRVRALADFYYSQAGRLLHALRPGPGDQRRWPTVAALARAAQWSEVGPGVEHACLDAVSAAGPIHVNLLRCSPGAVRLEVHDRREAVERGEPFDEYVRRSLALAAVSGGFFLYSEADIAAPSRRFDPVGFLASEGRVMQPPVFARGSVVVETTGRIRLRRVGWDDCEATLGGARLPVERAVNRATGLTGPDVPSIAIVGDCVSAVGRALPVPLNGYVVPWPATSAATVGDVIAYAPRVQAAVSGGPMLVMGGQPALDYRAEDLWGTAPPVTFSQDETGDHNLLPRLVAGTMPNDSLIFAAIDGRHFERALGMTLAQSGALLQALGCTDVVNLDGGSSKRMVVDGRIVDLPSTEMRTGTETETSVRPVHTCVLIRTVARHA